MPKLKRGPHPKPLVLVGVTDEAQRRDLSAALAADFRVTTANDEQQLLTAAHVSPPDAIVLDCGVTTPSGTHGLCGTLHAFALATPIVLVLPGRVSRAQEHDGLKAGAWAVLGTPTDAEALTLRLHRFVEPKRELDRVSEECLVDRVSGLYNYCGLQRRAVELAALATRHGMALACAVFRPVAELPNHSAGDRLAVAFKRVGRASDALGRTGRAEFALFAPATNGTAVRLVRRMTETVERAFGNLREGYQRVGVRSGFSTALAAHRISPPMLLARARAALATGG
jgi:PleD family two-component response regulator